MKRTLLSLSLGASLVGIAALAACGGGGSGAPSALPASNTGSGSAPASITNGVSVTLTIDRSQKTTAKPAIPRGGSALHRAAAAARRSPAYVSSSALGLQVAVSAGTASKSVFVDISQTSSLCTFNATTSIETCTFAVPTLATTESIVATEVDKAPTALAAGYGTGIPANANILAVGTLSATTTPGTVTALTLGLNPVWTNFIGFFGEQAPSNLNASTDPTLPTRMLVTGNLAQYAEFVVGINDADGDPSDPNNLPTDPNPTNFPFVDVNGTPQPITVTSTVSGVQFAAIPLPTSTPNPPLSSYTYGLVASAANQTYEWFNEELINGAHFDGTLSAPTTVTVSNHLSAANPFSPNYTPPPAQTYTIVPVTASPSAVTVSMTGPTTATITGSDFGASTGGLYAQGSHDSSGFETPGTDGDCLDADGSTVRATVAYGSINTSTWLETFTVTPVSVGTCTFTIADENTGTLAGYPGATAAAPITVTINP
jgi:hypothetical protein